jgi:Fe-S cluster assembly iron-binding protein IscA
MTITDIAKKEINTILAQNKGKSLRVYMAGFG